MNARLHLSILALATLVSTLSITPSVAQAAGWKNCTANAVYETNPGGGNYQIQIGCAAEYQTGYSFAAIVVNSYSADQKERLLSMALASILSGRRFRFYATDTDCPGLTNCKLITSWSTYTP